MRTLETCAKCASLPQPRWWPSDTPWPTVPEDGWMRLHEAPQAWWNGLGLLVPVEWPDWLDEERLSWVRRQLEILRRPHSPSGRDHQRTLQNLRNTLSMRISRGAAAVGLAEIRESVLVAQAGKCAICADPVVGRGGTLYHDRTCCPGPALTACGACFRGVICGRCSFVIKMSGSRQDLLEAAAAFVAPRTS